MTLEDYDPPTPTPLIADVPPAPDYPLHELGPLEAVARAVHDKVQAPAAIGAQSALCIAAFAVQGLADVETLAGTAPCSLFGLTIALSGERKSSCDRLLMTSVYDHQRSLMDAAKDEQAQHENDLQIWDVKATVLKKAVAAGDEAAERELRALDPKPEPPLSGVVCPGDPTFEGLVKLFAVGRPSLGLFNDEAGSFVGGHSMGKDHRLKTMAGLSKLWDGGPINRTRGGDGAESLYGRRLSTHLLIQLAAAAGLLSDPVAAAQGFLPRFLISHPNSTIGTRTATTYQPASDAAIAAFHGKIGLLLRLDLPLREGTRNELVPRVLALSPDARQLLQGYAIRIEKMQVIDGPLRPICAFASKSAEQAARIAGVLTLYENPYAMEVSRERMINGIELAQYYLEEALRIGADACVPEDVQNAETIRRWFGARWCQSYISVRAVVKSGPNAVRNTTTVRAAFRVLEENDWIIRVDGPIEIAGAKSKEVWRIHEQCFSDSAEA